MYRSKDYNFIMESVETIKNKALEKYKTDNEPTLEENYNVVIELIKYIIQKNRILYGGYAQNLLISIKNKNDCFYKEHNGVYYNWPIVADIEFYTCSPIKDIIEITEILLTKGFSHIEAKEGVHSSTFKLFVNFINYCDITYMPNNIYNNIPTVKIRKMRCIVPHFMMIDAYRILTDPLTSYWRLDKAIIRFQKLLSNFNYDKTLIKKKINYVNNNNDITKNIMVFINKNILINSNLIIIGYFTYNYYINKVNKQDVIKNIPYYELITDNLNDDYNKIYKALNEKYKNKITVKFYSPYFQFLDNRIEYYYDNDLILILYGNNKKCTVYNYIQTNKIYIGTFNLTIMYYLINYFYCITNKLFKESNIFLIIISKLHYYRIIYLNKKNITVLDESPFKDFTLNCHGIPYESIRENRLKNMNRKIKKFIYTPSGNKKIINESYYNISGNKVNNIFIKN